jgi:hypothetical protein
MNKTTALIIAGSIIAAAVIFPMTTNYIAKSEHAAKVELNRQTLAKAQVRLDKMAAETLCASSAAAVSGGART